MVGPLAYPTVARRVGSKGQNLAVHWGKRKAVWREDSMVAKRECRWAVPRVRQRVDKWEKN